MRPWKWNVRQEIERKIKELDIEYQDAQGLILSENDLKCLVYQKLMDIPQLATPIPTEDTHVLSHPVHTELPWYDRQEKLTIRPDITIVDPSHLSILHGRCGIRLLPSKGCVFDGDAIIFELKFARAKSGLTRRFCNSIETDFQKIQRLYSRLDRLNYSGRVFCYFLICNKTSLFCSEFKQLMATIDRCRRYKLIYFSGNVQFQRRKQREKRVTSNFIDTKNPRK